MPNARSPVLHQDLLRAYLLASDAEADLELARILIPARQIISRVVSSVYRDPGSNDAEDVISDTVADLLRRLRDLRGDPARSIEDLRGYIVRCAYNRCHERLRERYPARNRLRNQLQYLFKHDARLALWRTAGGVMVCGLASMNGREPLPSSAAEAIHLAARSDPNAENRAEITRLAEAIVRKAGGPFDLETLVAAIGRLIDLEQQRAEVPLELIEQRMETAADEALELRGSLRDLWNDIRQLAPKQRAALLLNLTDVHGRECTSLLPLTKTATIAEIAAAVEMPLEQFAAIWNDLPLSDVAIAGLLHATPRQVIKLRRLARERLRRMESRRSDQNLRAEFDSSSLRKAQ